MDLKKKIFSAPKRRYINSSKYNSIIIIEISGTFPALISSISIT